jgi:hypothetical protein
MRLQRRLPFLLGFSLFAATAAMADAPSICDGISGNLVLNCGFELPYAGDGSVPVDWTGAQFTDFEDVVTDPVNSGTYSMRIANDEFQGGEPLFNGAAILSQSFTDVSGENYTFAFYLYNGEPNGSEEQFQAFWGPSSNPTSVTPLFVDTGSAPNSWVLQTFTVTGTGSDTITFTSYNTPSFYYLDDVSLVGSGVSVPEPASFIPLALLVMVGIGILRRSQNSRSRAV